MHDLLFENQTELGEPLFSELVETLTLSATALDEALEGGKYEPRVRTDFSGGVRSGVNGTPICFINGIRHDAAFEFEDLIWAIDEAAGKAKKVARG
jgi:protein-disulfide isomerase